MRLVVVEPSCGDSSFALTIQRFLSLLAALVSTVAIALFCDCHEAWAGETVERRGVCCASLLGNCVETTEAECAAQIGCFQLDSAPCDQFPCRVFGIKFRRGDHDGSGLVDMADGIGVLEFLFLGRSRPICNDASDADNRGMLDISDAINLFAYLFLGTVKIPPPGTSRCDSDPTEPIDDRSPGDPLGPDGLPEQPLISLGCDQYPAPEFHPQSFCPCGS